MILRTKHALSYLDHLWIPEPEQMTPEEEIDAHKAILEEIERDLKWYRYVGDHRKVAELEAERIRRREEIRRLGGDHDESVRESVRA